MWCRFRASGLARDRGQHTGGAAARHGRVMPSGPPALRRSEARRDELQASQEPPDLTRGVVAERRGRALESASSEVGQYPACTASQRPAPERPRPIASAYSPGAACTMPTSSHSAFFADTFAK